MIMKKQQDITKLSLEDLKKEILGLSSQLVNLKLTNRMAPIENPLRIRSMRKSIARLNTELSKRNQA
jgi:large subunit ribosomal protein L29